MFDQSRRLSIRASTFSSPGSGPTLKSPVTNNIESEFGEELYTLLLVTCYSEDQEGLYNTMSSLAATAYSDQKKMLFVIADGIITGSGNPKPTPDIVLDMLEIDPAFEFPPMPLSYLAVADGSKRHNMACVYAAWFNYEGRRIPTILIVKTGTPRERNGPKPGNRGKRDSQMILMSFLNKITFDDPMVPLEYDLFQKMRHLMGVTPDNFEIVLMVDADTKVAPDSLARMVACMVDDPLVIGLCGETRIANKTESWVSRIQVFEYYLSHHLNKKFESVFGGVTCLPGCFCMYRIKCPKDGKWVPILCNPEIIDTYSETVVDTLHKKNLLLLGEDRFLTTLMLRTFPHRKMIFVPKAFCKTMVPANFRVLLSQRRRWINSTIHNLFELVLVRELCGIFCFSMQAVILLELIGTLTLPAAIIFTTVLIIMSFYQGITGGVAAVPWVPLALLFAILGLPAVLILLTSRRLVYIYWLVVYLLALPIWNFVLPVYAFWHFDDFSWGETRKVQGEGADGGHGESDGHFAGNVKMRRWCEWEYERRRLQRELYSEPREAIGAADGEIVAAPARTSSSRRI
ncbi:chitin synthase-domain-containing protein [Polychytrium aggregatum]|uniref:chitin synthase-domain-containing protein n=1 Tax=Polychytrium aggregatum TaxID=110093 RepID=UPI0022FEEA6D|nr:chitin synthase-domain-containing protein [Polychytrium aggregatum]KAI9207158.1 chitin synthase-domain-containing protein [Polychytrium aggregatum]